MVAILIQAVPYGRNHSNPPVIAEPDWATPQTRALAVAACFDCHSNEAEYPWYSSVAPFSWAVQNHVEEGRRKLNFSEWDRPQREADESAETLLEGSMPPLYYTIAHPGSRLTGAEKRELAAGFRATPGIGR
ncbi:heme-binding domain-containing protein [bacterium]|nr:heme-binding domain-containing protein [bacterium]